MNLFVYGTLMDECVRAAVMGSRSTVVEATVDGFARYAIDGECYPAAVSESEARIEGIVLLDILVGELSVLDRYEGDWYVRRGVRAALTQSPVPVSCSPVDKQIPGEVWGADYQAPNQETMACEMYLLQRTQLERIASRTAWSLARFVAADRERFLEQVRSGS